MWNEGEEFTVEGIISDRLDKEFNNVEIKAYGYEFDKDGFKETVTFSFSGKKIDKDDSIIKFFTDNWYVNNKKEKAKTDDKDVDKLEKENARLKQENARLKQLAIRIDEEYDNFLDKYDDIMQEYEDILPECRY